MATPPITIIKMASTFARTGRAIKKSEIMAPRLFGARARRRRRSGGRKLRIDLLTRDRPQDAGNNDMIVGLEPALDHTQVADPGADRDLALLDRIVVVEHEQITSALVAAERGIRYQQRLLLVGGANPHAHEIARHQHPAPHSAGWRGRQASRSPGRWREKRSSACLDTDIPGRSAVRLRLDTF